MHARWRFRLVRTDRSGSYWTENWRVLELIGSDAEALAMAWDIVAPIVHEVAHIQAVSVGRPSEITDTPGRLLIFVHARLDGRGWDLHGDMMHDCWQVSLVQAVDYVASRTAGYTSETRIINVLGTLTHVVLVPGGGRKLTLKVGYVADSVQATVVEEHLSLRGQA